MGRTRTIRIVIGGRDRPLGTLRLGAQGTRESAAFSTPEWLASADRFGDRRQESAARG